MQKLKPRLPPVFCQNRIILINRRTPVLLFNVPVKTAVVNFFPVGIHNADARKIRRRRKNSCTDHRPGLHFLVRRNRLGKRKHSLLRSKRGKTLKENLIILFFKLCQFPDFLLNRLPYRRLVKFCFKKVKPPGKGKNRKKSKNYDRNQQTYRKFLTRSQNFTCKLKNFVLKTQKNFILKALYK